MVDINSQRELRNDSGRIMRCLDEGRTFVVTRHSTPVGELRPVCSHALVDARVVAAAFRGAPPIEADRFRRDLDVVADQDVEPRT